MLQRRMTLLRGTNLVTHQLLRALGTPDGPPYRAEGTPCPRRFVDAFLLDWVGPMSPHSRLQKYLHDWRTFPADAALAYRNNGMGGVWDAVAARSVHRVVRTGRMIVFAQPLEGVAELPLPAGVAIGALRESDWPALESLVTGREMDRFRHPGGRTVEFAWSHGEARVPLAMPGWPRRSART